MTTYTYEKVWLNISSDISSTSIIEFSKSEVFFMKNTDICFFIGEIDFTSGHDVSTHIEINLPELSLYNFVPCENTILATKNADVETFVKVRLEPGKLHLYSYPFDPDTKYEFNIQLFMRKILDINK